MYFKIRNNQFVLRSDDDFYNIDNLVLLDF